MATRLGVYKALDSERAYQNDKWGPSHDQHNPHSVTEWLVFMQYYVNEGLKVATLTNEPETTAKALEFVRKVAALGVVAMEQHGAPQREGFEQA